MVIKLYYIEGISRIDTPYYAKQGQQATLAAQEAFFEDHVVVELDTAFYPPHYTNEVKLTTDDIDFNTNVNYLSLEFNNKTYYYFIDDVEYISENMVKLFITMDTIQTYMFDIYIASGIVTRKFINRWNSDDTINRNYLRENVANEEFIPVDFTIINGDTSKWVAIAKKTEQYTYDQVSGKVNYYLDDNQTQIGEMSNIPTSCTYGIVPLVSRTNAEAVQCYNASSGTDITLQAHEATYDQATYNVAITKAWCVDMYVCPFTCIMGFVFNNDGLTISIDDTRLRTERLDIDTPPPMFDTPAGDWLISNKKATESWGHNTVNVMEYDICWNKHITTLNFYKNTNPLADFDSVFVPALIDNNYIRYTFGSFYANTTYPLYTLKTPTLYNWFTFIIDSGARVYLVNEFSDRVDDVYRVGVTDDNIINLALKNNAWESYVSQNRSRWVGAIGQTAINIASKGATTGLRNSFIDRDINNIRFDPKSYTPKRGKLSKKSQREIDALAKQKGLNEGMFDIDTASAAANGILGQALADINAQLAPTSMKSSANTDGMINKAAWIFSEVEFVRDFAQCAHYYHRNGYKVDLYVDDIDNIFDFVQNRIYYNMLQMSVPEVHLRNVIEDETTIDSIKERLELGIRLWRFDGGVTVSNRERANVHFEHSLRISTVTYYLSEEWTDVTSIEVQLARPTQGQTLNVTLVGTPQVSKIGNRFVVTIAYTNSGEDIDWDVISDITGRKTLNNHIGNYKYDNVELDYLQ